MLYKDYAASYFQRQGRDVPKTVRRLYVNWISYKNVQKHNRNNNKTNFRNIHKYPQDSTMSIDAVSLQSNDTYLVISLSFNVKPLHEYWKHHSNSCREWYAGSYWHRTIMLRGNKSRVTTTWLAKQKYLTNTLTNYEKCHKVLDRCSFTTFPHLVTMKHNVLWTTKLY
jgi:hypothetical protein